MGKLMRVTGAAALVSAAVAMTACQAVRSDVTRFHQMPTKGDGQTVFISSSAPAKNATMEFQAYAAMIAPHFEKAGYRPVPAVQGAALVAFVDYGVLGKTTETVDMPIMGQTGGGMSTFSGQVSQPFGSGFGVQQFSGTAYTPPTFGVTGYIPVKNDVYHRRLTMDVYRLNPADPKASPQIFSGTVNSDGSSSTFNEVADCMVAALFKGFPGASGKTERIEIAKSECQ